MLNGQYGEGVVQKLAKELSKELGFNVRSQRLYEYAKVARAFRDINEIYKVAGTKDITWEDVLRYCRVRRLSKLVIQITLDPDKDTDIARFKEYKPKVRNEFFKEAIRIGIKNLKHMKKLPPLKEIKGIITFAQNSRMAV